LNLNELFAKAIEQYQVGSMVRAIELYRHLVLQFPGYAPAWNNLGVALRATDKFAAAASALRRGPALNDQDAGAWSNLGNALRSVGEYEEAASAHQKSLTLDPAAGRVHYNLALVKRDMGDLDAAIVGLGEAESRGFGLGFDPLFLGLAVALRTQ
jgi:tetratricopeptide (TPR) repeat protein